MLGLTAWFGAVPVRAAGDGLVPLWHRTDIVLHSSVTYENPYADVEIDAVFTHEDGDEIFLYGFWNGGRDGGLRIEDGTVSGYAFRTDYNWSGTTNQWFLVAGDAPRINVSTSFRNEKTDAAYLQNSDTFFRFSVPEEGWARAPIYSISASERFAALKGAGGGLYVFSIDPKSPMLNTGRTRTVPLVAWINGVDEANVAFEAEPPHGVEFVWTYSWPSRPKDHPAANEYPTGIAAVLRGHGATFLIFK